MRRGPRVSSSYLPNISGLASVLSFPSGCDYFRGSPGRWRVVGTVWRFMLCLVYRHCPPYAWFALRAIQLECGEFSGHTRFLGWGYRLCPLCHLSSARGGSYVLPRPLPSAPGHEHYVGRCPCGVVDSGPTGGGFPARCFFLGCRTPGCAWSWSGSLAASL